MTQSGQLSPVSSISGPTRPSAPMSPVNFEDYSSDWDFDFESRTSLQRGRSRASRSTMPNTTPHTVSPSCPRVGTASPADDVSRRRQGGNDVDGLFSFDEARRVLDELNNRLRTSGVGTQQTLTPREVIGVDPRRGRISSADGARTSARLIASDTGLGNNSGKNAKTSDWKSAPVGVKNTRSCADKQPFNYPE